MTIGVDYKHEALGGCLGKGCKVAYGYDLVGDDYNAEIPGSTPKPDDDPLDDCGKDSGASGKSTIILLPSSSYHVIIIMSFSRSRYPCFWYHCWKV